MRSSSSNVAQEIQWDLAAAGIMLVLDGLPNVTGLPLYRNATNRIGAVPHAYGSNVQGVACHSAWAIDFHPIRRTV